MTSDEASQSMRHKAVAYVTRGEKVLVFRHAHFPEVGLQVPSGTVGHGEQPYAAAVREVEEEAGLTDLRLVCDLGTQLYDMRPLKDQIHQRHFFHLACDKAPERWTHQETHPDSSGIIEPIALEFCWAKPDGTDLGLVAGQGNLLSRLRGGASARTPHRRSFVRELAGRIAAFRCRKAETLNKAFGSLLPGYAIAGLAEDAGLYAAAGHTFYAVLKAAAAQDAPRTARLLSSLRAWSRTERREPPLVVNRDDCSTVHDEKFDSPLHVWEADRLPQDGTIHKRVVGALAVLRRLHYDELIDGHLGMVVTMGQRGRSEPTRSFTISAFPGTIFIDDVEDDIRLAELLLHESAHNWLNEALAAASETISVSGLLWSPWKQAMRPAYGIIQAAFAFSQMMQFFADMLDDPALSRFGRAYCSERLQADGATLRQGLGQLVEAAGLIRDPVVRGLILDEANRALQFDVAHSSPTG